MSVCSLTAAWISPSDAPFLMAFCLRGRYVPFHTCQYILYSYAIKDNPEMFVSFFLPLSFQNVYLLPLRMSCMISHHDNDAEGEEEGHNEDVTIQQAYQQQILVKESQPEPVIMNQALADESFFRQCAFFIEGVKGSNIHIGCHFF